MTKTYEVRTYGCQMNVHDSERLGGLLETDGYVRADEGATPDLVVFNTCAVRENADNKLYGNLGHIASVKEKNPGMQIAVGGCLAQKDRDTITKKAPYVDVVFGTHNIGSLPVLLERARIAEESQVEAVAGVLPATLEPELAGMISVSRPSDALAAKRATQGTFSALFLGLAAVALVVGGIGVANTMIVSVMERRREIGMRQALGATRLDIRLQFVTEAIALSTLGGAAGLLLGCLGTAAFAAAQGWPPVIPVAAMAGGFVGAMAIGALAGLYPAMLAARLSPTEALRT